MSQNRWLMPFWAPWCAPCIQQEPELAEINRELRAKNIGTGLAHLRALLNRAEG